MARTVENERYIDTLSWGRAIKEMLQTPKSQNLKQGKERLEEERRLSFSQDFPLANPKIIYGVNNEVEIIGNKFPEGVLPSNAVPLRKANILTKTLLEIKQLRKKLSL